VRDILAQEYLHRDGVSADVPAKEGLPREGLAATLRLVKTQGKKAAKAARDQHQTCRTAGRVTPEADLTWLLHRAAWRMRAQMEERAAAHGVDLRGYLVLTALGEPEGRTQLALGQALGLDKTTLTSLLDRLERDGLVVRCADPGDRRARIPTVTEAGRALQGRVARSITESEDRLLARFGASDRRALRAMLCELIGSGDAAAGAATPAGSCV
jgi:DNA-binding MarR family transcriptional regulator